MPQIKENQDLIMENVLSFRGKGTQQQMQEEVFKIEEVLNSLDAKKNGPITTATYFIEGNLIDIEILVPLDRKVKIPSPYKYKSIIKLVHALYIRHEGNSSKSGDTINILNKYIIENNKQVITPTYNVTIKKAIGYNDLDNMIIDVYVGCNPCIL